MRNAVSKVARVYRAKVFGISLTLLSAPLKTAKDGLIECKQNGFRVVSDFNAHVSSPTLPIRHKSSRLQAHSAQFLDL